MLGHGTHVSATIGGKRYGIAKKISLYGVKVLGDNGTGNVSGVIAVRNRIVLLDFLTFIGTQLGGPTCG